MVALRVASMPQESVMSWLWAISVLYALTLGPVVFLALTLIWALRDFARGQRIQAVMASGVGVATTLLLFGRIGMDF
jgi:hypothetical protein